MSVLFTTLTSWPLCHLPPYAVAQAYLHYHACQGSPGVALVAMKLAKGDGILRSDEGLSMYKQLLSILL